MGHMIRAFIGKDITMQTISENWVQAEKIKLPQGFALIFLTDYLFDDIEELFNEEKTYEYPFLKYFSKSINSFLSENSFNCQILYIETDYFGGYGSQAGVLFENGIMKEKPINGNGTVNRLLKNIGVYKEKGKDEFDSLHLYRFRHID